MLVFRIENAVGYDPYRNYHTMGEYLVNPKPPKFNLSDIHSVDKEHPLPQEDGIKNVYYDEFCGFASLDSMVEWFDGCFEKLEEDGYFVTIFEIESSLVRLGTSQLVFHRGKSQIVDSFDPNWKRNERISLS